MNARPPKLNNDQLPPRVMTSRGWRRGRIVAVALITLALVGATVVILIQPRLAHQALAAPGAFAITNVTIVNVMSGELREHMTVLVEGTRISAILPPEQRVSASAATDTIEGRGKFLIPGLWDMHAHGSSSTHQRALYARLLVANGITGIRLMETSLAPAEIGQREPGWHDQLLEPRSITSGRVINAQGLSRTSISVRAAANVPAAVDSVVNSGAAFVKVYNLVPRPAYFELLREAEKRQLAVVGHVPWGITAAEASDSGQRSLEHLAGIALSCSAREDELRNALLKIPVPNPGVAAAVQRVERTSTASYDESRCRSLAQRLARNGTWVVPTLVSLGAKLRFSDDSGLSFMPGWQANARHYAARAADAIRRDSAVFDRHLRIAGLLHQEKVRMLAGSDMLASFVVPGFSLHRELELMVMAGFTPLEALQSATIHPAQFLAAQDTLGSIAPGKTADMVLLEGNPLAAIDNTRRIAAVILRGRYLDRTALDEELRAVRRYVRRSELLARLNPRS